VHSSLESALAALATRQHGVVSRGQLLELGFGRRGISRRLASGRLLPLHRGVYAVGHRAVSRDGRLLAAVLAVGPGAVLSHRSAAELWGIRRTSRQRIEVTVPRALKPRPGIEIHRRDVPPDEQTTHQDIPVTTVPRTLVDLAAVLRPTDLRRAAEQAEVNRLADPLPLNAVVRRHQGRHGIKTLKALTRDGIEPRITRSELEQRFLSLVEANGLPKPQTNAAIQQDGTWIEVDCLWQKQKLVVELDGHAYHSTREAFERDRERDRRLEAAGYRVIRITWRQLRDDPGAVARDLAKLLAVRPR
jgi:very-short-patch-repair endonuclease